MKARYDLSISPEEGGYEFDVDGRAVIIHKYAGGQCPEAVLVQQLQGQRTYIGRAELSDEFFKIVQDLEAVEDETVNEELDRMYERLMAHLRELAVRCTQ